MDLKRKGNEENDRIGIKKFFYSQDTKSKPNDGEVKSDWTLDNQGNLGGLVTKSFYGSKSSYINPFERRLNRVEHVNDVINNSDAGEKSETFCSEKNSVSDFVTNQAKLNQRKSINDASGKLDKVRRMKQNSNKFTRTDKIRVEISRNADVSSVMSGINNTTKVTKIKGPAKEVEQLGEISDSTDVKSHDGSGILSVSHSANKFFCSRSPKKRALLKKRGPAVLIGRGFSVKFQLKSGPKLQKPLQKQTCLPRNNSPIHRNRCVVAEEDDIESCDIINKEQNSDNSENSCCDVMDENEIGPNATVDGKLISNGSKPQGQLCKADHGTFLPQEQEIMTGAKFTGNATESIVTSEAAADDELKISASENKTSSQCRLFSIFGRDPSPEVRTTRQKILTTSNSLLPQEQKTLTRPKKTDKEQMILDFGQKLMGSFPCSVCGMTYLRGDKADEVMHNKFHQRVLNALKFPGWQKERVVQDFLDGSRVIMVVPDDKFALKKLEAIKSIVDEDLGFVVDDFLTCLWKAFLYIKDKKVVGFCLAQSINMGFRMLGADQSSESTLDAKRPFCCEDSPVPVGCGISRIWVLSAERRKHIATKILDVVRSQFMMGCVLSRDQLAFSDPTPDGMKFASKYTGTQCFLVFRK